jgi:hypothetical protein
MFRFITISSLVGFCLLFAVAQSTQSKSGVDTLPDGPGKEAVQKNCLSCHNARIATSKRGTEDEWADTVSKMVARGANIPDNDVDTIIEYMATHFGPENSKHSQSGESKAEPALPKRGNGETQSRALVSVCVNRAGAIKLMTSLDLSKEAAEAIIHDRDSEWRFQRLRAGYSIAGR